MQNFFKKAILAKTKYQKSLEIVARKHLKTAEKEILVSKAALEVAVRKYDHYRKTWGTFAPEQLKKLQLQKIEAQKQLLTSYRVLEFTTDTLHILQQRNGPKLPVKDAA